MPRQKNYCFTLNNYTESDLEDVIKFRNDYCQYISYSREVGESGTPHLQGWFILKKESSMKSIKSVGLKKAHLEVMRGSPLENEDYINKQHDAITWGTQSIVVPNLEAVMLVLLPYIEKMHIVEKTEKKARVKLLEYKRSIYLRVASEFPIQCIRHKKGIVDYIHDIIGDRDPIYIEGDYYIF